MVRLWVWGCGLVGVWPMAAGLVSNWLGGIGITGSLFTGSYLSQHLVQGVILWQPDVTAEKCLSLLRDPTAMHYTWLANMLVKYKKMAVATFIS